MLRIPAMTLDEKIAQLFMLRVHGATADTADPDSVGRNRALYGVDNAHDLVSAYQPGGIVYFRDSGNIRNPAQIAQLSNDIQHAALNRPASDPVPLLIATDQEGGRVARMSPPATWFPAARALASVGRDAVYEAATIMGRELRAMGITLNYAPVADVNVNPDNPVIGDRAFGLNPHATAPYVCAQIRGFQQGGLAATAKHFPGHGDTTVDTHTGRAVVAHSREEWEELDLPPFKAAIDEGADAIMTGHLVFPALDRSGTIGTTSYPIITELLRGELGFDGVVVTDGLEMAAVQLAHNKDEAPLRALQAGVDQLLLPADGAFPSAVKTIRRAVEDEELSVDRIDESVERILRLKHRCGIIDEPLVDTDVLGRTVGTLDHQQTARRLIAAAS